MILAAALAIPVASATLGSASVSAGSVAEGAAAVSAANGNLDQAIGVRIAAERRVAELDASQRRLSASLKTRSAEAGAIAGQLAAARQEARQAAIDAYVAGGESQELVVFIRSDEVDDASARATVLSSQAHSAVDAAATFQKMKEENDPAVVELGETLDAVSAQLADARSALLQAEAQQADAELALTRAKDAEAVLAAANAKAATSAKAAPKAKAAARPKAAPVVNRGFGAQEADWEALRQCESGGNYQIVSSTGRYRGAYQFDRATWASMGGTGDPAAAPPAEQDMRAKMLYEQRGARPWPHCGKHLR